MNDLDRLLVAVIGNLLSILRWQQEREVGAMLSWQSRLAEFLAEHPGVYVELCKQLERDQLARMDHGGEGASQKGGDNG